LCEARSMPTLEYYAYGLPIARFFCFHVRISDLELYENLLWETIAIVDICGVRRSERNILNKLSRNLSHFSMTEFCAKSNGF
jgi:hypothetical protein